MDATRLDSIPDASVEEIQAFHLFEHLDVARTTAALDEWKRVLAPGGRLILELPNLARCLRVVGTHFDERGVDLAMCGIYGYPPDIAKNPSDYQHRWGWTPETLRATLELAGFTDVRQKPATQTWREATLFDRDMRIEATRPRDRAAAVPQPPAAPETDPLPVQDHELYALRKRMIELSRKNLALYQELERKEKRREHLLAEHEAAIAAERARHAEEIKRREEAIERLKGAVAQRDRIIDQLRSSTAWKIGISLTRPARGAIEHLRGRKG